MNVYKTQSIRKKHKIGINEEYILGIVDACKPVGTMDILDTAFTEMSRATAHKYLKQIERKKLVFAMRLSQDSRTRVFQPTPKGVDILKELHNAYR